MNQANVAKFREIYTQKLIEAIRRHPEEYRYCADEAPSVADKITIGLATGGASLGPVGKAVARALKIKLTYGAIKKFLNEPETVRQSGQGE